MRLPQEIKDKLIQMNKKFELSFGAYDLIFTPEGGYIFLELNANGQWGWIQELTKYPISSEIASLLVQKGHV